MVKDDSSMNSFGCEKECGENENTAATFIFIEGVLFIFLFTCFVLLHMFTSRCGTCSSGVISFILEVVLLLCFTALLYIINISFVIYVHHITLSSIRLLSIHFESNRTDSQEG